MRSSDRSSRRDFVCAAGLAAGLAAVGDVQAFGAADPPPTPDAVLARLLEGNKRFMAGHTSLLTRRRPEDFAALAEGQAPQAIILACADSRVAPELVFDQGIGDLFVVRVAGNVASGAGPIVKGSIEFAVAELGARLIMVLGHTECGAVRGAAAHVAARDALPGAIGPLVELIRPAVARAEGRPGNRLTNIIRANVEKCVETLKGLDPILSKFSGAGELKVVGAVYDLKTGAVDVFA
jgi:carbonic anhydrase